MERVWSFGNKEKKGGREKEEEKKKEREKGKKKGKKSRDLLAKNW